MGKTRLLVVIIETPYSLRSQPLLRTLKDDLRFEVVRLPALMLHSNSDVKKNEVDTCLDEFAYFQNRFMSPQEIGCAKSHNLARRLVSDSLIGGVILEDDARIENLDCFYNSALDFLELNVSKRAVLSLNEFRLGGKSDIDKKGYQLLLSKPYLALAYAITPLAAFALYEANEPIRNVADWPRVKIKYFSLFKSLVLHGDDQNTSTIDVHGELGRNGFKISKKVSRLMFITFFCSKPRSVSLSRYINEIYWASVTWHADSVLRQILRIVSK